MKLQRTEEWEKGVVQKAQGTLLSPFLSLRCFARMLLPQLFQ